MNLYKQIAEAQDALKLVCAPEKGKIRETQKRWMLRINDALRSWMILLATTGVRHTQLKKIGTLTRGVPLSDADLLRGHIVYARVNLKTRDMYIGETGHWHDRVKKHFVETYRHAALPTLY